MAKNNAKYTIEEVTYVKKPTGKTNKYGNPEYETVGQPKRRQRNGTNFAEVKKDLYEKSQKNKNMYVDYSKPTYRINKNARKLKSSTIRKADGSKEVTYYNVVRQCKNCDSKK